ncbi:uncharacterized protein N7515_003695 [Penicillium bovifimosum]|uniref:Uncharacterized protein n=1 Tax=Penicillium bovifimosum TaxID=126998 RepID=A0A9W9H558_9EURO|nr:uncharacterized protein N7515_003695 [Penicillium bovifimosum]KAJ5138847.1 hypothetical protein N7515_003695 [Penicillium bovifimosum]
MPIVRAMSRLTVRNTPCKYPLAPFYARVAPYSSKVSNPVASSPESQDINKARGLEGRHSDTADTRSTQSPISSSNKTELGSEAHEGEEQTSTDALIKNDPSKSPEAKRENVKKAGQKPMGPEDR